MKAAIYCMSRREEMVRRLTYRHNIASHLSQLSHLVNREVTADDLLSLEATEAIREQSRSLLKNDPLKKFQIQFSEKAEARFAAFIKNLHALNPKPIYIWTDHTIECGLYEVGSILEINFKFEYSKFPAGIMSFVTKDFSDKLLLDFFEESNGERFIEIELTGDHWPSCTYG